MAASPQTENGFTRVANELLEAILRYHCSGGEMGIIFALIRLTYGFQRKNCEVTLSKLADITERHKNKVAVDVRRLIQKKIIIELSPATFSRGRIIALNKDYTMWEKSHSMIPIPTEMSTVNESDGGRLIESASLSIKKKVKNNNTRSNNQCDRVNHSKTMSDAANRIYDYYANNVRSGARQTAIKSIIKLLKSYAEEDLRGTIERYKKSMPEESMYRIQANNFFGRAARFEEFLTNGQPQDKEAIVDTIEEDENYKKWKEDNLS
jgi:phage replication O-like protein O